MIRRLINVGACVALVCFLLLMWISWLAGELQYMALAGLGCLVAIAILAASDLMQRPPRTWKDFPHDR